MRNSLQRLRLKVKRKIYNDNTNRKKAGNAILILDEVLQKRNNRDKEGH